MTQPGHHVVIVGAGPAGRAVEAELTAAGIADVVGLDRAADVVSSVFDEGTDGWALHTATGEVVRGRIVIAAHSAPTAAWTPQLAGRGEFRGSAFPAAQRDPGFDPAGKRIAVIGADSVAGHYIGQLPQSASVTVFAHAPRRFIDELPLPSTRARRWLRRRLRPGATDGPSGPTLVGSAITAVSASGVRTRDGADHSVDAIVYGTGFTLADRVGDETLVGAGGLSIRRAWVDGMEPYFGVAVHGFPNYFFLGGPDFGAQARYVAECVRLMADRDATRIEVRRSSQQVFNERVYVRPPRPHRASRAFELSSRGRQDRQSYDGAATLTVAGTAHSVRVRLAGRLDPIDGQYHWQGTVFGSPSRPLPDEALRQSRTATLTVGQRSASARITEQTPWGTHAIAGVGVPPYPLGAG